MVDEEPQENTTWPGYLLATKIEASGHQPPVKTTAASRAVDAALKWHETRRPMPDPKDSGVSTPEAEYTRDHKLFGLEPVQLSLMGQVDFVLQVLGKKDTPS